MKLNAEQRRHLKGKTVFLKRYVNDRGYFGKVIDIKTTVLEIEFPTPAENGSTSVLVDVSFYDTIELFE